MGGEGKKGRSKGENEWMKAGKEGRIKEELRTREREKKERERRKRGRIKCMKEKEER